MSKTKGWAVVDKKEKLVNDALGTWIFLSKATAQEAADRHEGYTVAPVTISREEDNER